MQGKKINSEFSEFREKKNCEIVKYNFRILKGKLQIVRKIQQTLQEGLDFI